MGALFVFFGWIHAPSAIQTWGIIVFAIFVAAAIYMKGSLKENFGIGGPGSTLLNILMLVILFQAIVGLVNLPSVALFNGNNVAPTPAEYQSIDLAGQYGSLANSGGWMQAAISMATLFLTAIIGIVEALIGMLYAIIWFPGVLQSTLPVLTSSPMVMQAIVVAEIAEWIIITLFFYNVFYTKSPWAVDV
jgi:hypothetical protein